MKMWEQLIEAGDRGVVLYAYSAQERLRELLALAGINPDRSVTSDPLRRL